MRKLTTLLIIFLFSAAQVWAQNRTVTGKVTDEKGATVAGATVKANGSSKGTSTSADGGFSLSVPTTVKSLTISGLGLETKSITIPSSGVVNVSMTAASTSPDLEEVVVQVPYGSVKKTKSIGSVSQITASQISRQQVTAVTNALEGLVPGIIATNGGGQPGNSNSDIRIRGFGSLNGSKGPLYILNGVVYNSDISLISTDDIETVDVMKDAAATSLYGARAANGVIMITTKKGKKGRFQTGLNIRQGFSTRGIPEYDLLDQKNYYEVAWDAAKNSNLYGNRADRAANAGFYASEEITGSTYLNYNSYNVAGNKLVDSKTGKLNPNAKLLWNDKFSDYLFRTATRTNINFNVSGATDKSDFFLSAGVLDEKGTMISSDFKRYTLRIGVNNTPVSWISTGFNMDAAYALQNYTQSASSVNPFVISREIAPIYPVFQRDLTTGALVLDKNGNKIYDYGTPKQMGSRPYQANSNALGTLMLDQNGANYLNSNVSGNVEVRFLKNFAFKNTVGATVYDERDKSFDNNEFGAASSDGGRTTISHLRTIDVTINQVLTWSKNFGNHSLRVLAGHESYLRDEQRLSASGRKNIYNNLNELDNDSTIGSNPNSNINVHRIESYFSGLNYDYKGRYLLGASFRRDGSSRFKNNRWGNFYSASVGWRLSEEDFLKKIKWINELKVKASFGQQGNENLGTGLNYYIDRQFFEADGQGGYKDPTRKENADLKWEKGQILNLGVDFSLFNKKLQGTVEFFDRYTTDMLFDVQLPSSSGFTYQYRNAGKMRNYGIEISLGYNAIQTKKFDWRVDLNLSTFKNVILETEKDLTAGFQSREMSLAKILPGHSIYDFFYLRQFVGVDPTNGLAMYTRDVMNPTTNKPTGEQTLVDEPALGSFAYNGSAIPKFTGGFINSFRYRNYELSINTTFSYGGKFYDGNYATLMGIGNLGTNWHTDILNRWQKPGDITNTPRVQYNSIYAAASTRFLFDASFLNIKNITFNYTLPRVSASKIGVEKIVLSISVDNAYLFTAKKGGNPQSAFSGLTSSGYPPFRTFSFGLNCNF